MNPATSFRSTWLMAALALMAAGCFQQSPSTPDTSATPTTAPTTDASADATGAPTTTAAQADDRAGCIAQGTFDPEQDYFPDKVQFEDATLVSIDYHKSYKTLTITNPETKDVHKAVLVQCGAKAPELTGDLQDATVVTVPAMRMVAPSTTEISNVELLGALDHIGATGATEYLSSATALAHFKDKNIPAIANQSGEMDAEKTIAVKPDVVFMAGMESDAYQVIEDAKIPVLDDNAWLESTPLGRAEWLKFFAALTNTEAKANTEYARIKQAYGEVKAKVGQAATKPTVLAGSTYEGQWYVPGRDSYVARFIEDAGGTYVMASQPGGGSDPVDFEKVIAEGGQADIWINAQSSAPAWASTADIIAADARLGELKAVKDGKVFNPMKRIGPSGGNDYWELGVIQPDVVLNDLAAAFHPEQFSGYESTYYLNVGP